MSLLDDFNRADGALGANWTKWISTDADLVVHSNAAATAATTSTWARACWTAASFAADQEVKATWAYSTSLAQGFLLARVTNPGLASRSGYGLAHTYTQVVLYRIVSGTATAISTIAGFSRASGDLIRFTVANDGNGDPVLDVYKIHAGVETSVGTYTDSNAAKITGGGYIGCGINNTSGQPAWSASWDDFSGGDLVIPRVPRAAAINHQNPALV